METSAVKKTLILLLIALAASPSARALMIIYQQGANNALVTNYQGTDDAYIVPGAPNNNYGQYGAQVSPTGTRGLMRFNLSSLSGKFSAINSVSLQLNISILSGSVTTGTIQAFAISSANSGWVEGTAYGSAQTGSSSWNYAKNTTQAWAGSAGLSTAGTDYDSTLLGSFDYNGVGTYSMTFNRNSSQLTTLISSWNNATNPGILLTEGNPSRDGYSYIYGSEDSTLSRRPKLTIDYVPEPGTGALVALGCAALSRLRRCRR